jgi:hypothetical protein
MADMTPLLLALSFLQTWTVFVMVDSHGSGLYTGGVAQFEDEQDNFRTRYSAFLSVPHRSGALNIEENGVMDGNGKKIQRAACEKGKFA